jgi:zinc and cadmium transporter
MSEYAWLTIYCTLVLLFSLSGGYLPFLGKVTHARLQLYLSAAAGVMLGASFFHVMPEAMEYAGANFGWWMSLGVVGLFCIERFIAPHSHELDGGRHDHNHGHSHPEDHGHVHREVLAHDHEHSHWPGDTKDHRAAAPAVAGWMAVLGLTIHTFMNGVGLAGAVYAGFREAGTDLTFAFPGFALFLAIVLHKPADALAISMVLSRKGVSRNKLMLVQLGFAAMVPIGVAAFYLTQSRIEADMRNELTGAALAFSAGTFLFIALSDLLPEVQFHRHDRIPLFLALILGVGLMGGLAYLEEHDHGHGHSHHSAGGPGKHDDHDEDHHHKQKSDGDHHPKDDHDHDH